MPAAILYLVGLALQITNLIFIGSGKIFFLENCFCRADSVCEVFREKKYDNMLS
jgi:hypothetical protein